MSDGFEEEDEGEEVYDPEALTFDEFVAMLRRWDGVIVGVTVQGPPSRGGNTTLTVRGKFEIDDDLEVGVIDPRGGRIEAFRVGDGQVQMLEGDFAAAETTDWGDQVLSVSADFREVTLNFVGPAASDSQ